MGDIRVGKPDTKPDAPAHTPGVSQGNEPGGIEGDPGLYETDESFRKAQAGLELPGNPRASTPRPGTR